MKKEDARISKSKTFLKRALLSMLGEEKLSKIKINTLCERAEINRATFYAHYKDVNELFDEIINEFMSYIYAYISKISDSEKTEDTKKLFLSFIKYIDKNSDLFILIFENSNNVEKASEQYEKLREKVNRKISFNYDKSTFSLYITNFYFYAGGAILHTWIKNGKKEAHQEIALLMMNLINKGASYYTSY